MLRVAALLASLVLAFLLPGPAHADFAQSKAWFESLPAEERASTQADLILLGHYEYLVDGQFGTGTYDALLAFQRSQGHDTTGALSEGDRLRLSALAAQVYDEFGMATLRDEAAQAELVLPQALLTLRTPAERGNSYAAPDGGLALETLRVLPSEQTFRTLYDTLKTPGAGRFILYANYNDQRFVVSGKREGRSFYAMFRNVEGESIGYILDWSDHEAERARMLSTYIASNFVPVRLLPSPPQTKLEETPAGNLRFGVFELPAEAPDTIVLNGEVTPDLDADFREALAARPAARVLLLNSPGGYVDNALAVAQEVNGRGMATAVAEGMGCYSACSYIFFAGSPRLAVGELGVHQISAEVDDLVMAQTTLSDVLDALDRYGVAQPVITQMLRTPPEEMYIFTREEIEALGINLGSGLEIADVTLGRPAVEGTTTRPSAGPAWVELALRASEAEAEQSLAYARERWGSLLGGLEPLVERAELPQGAAYMVRVPARSVENANAICEAIKSAGGGCYVTTGGG